MHKYLAIFRINFTTHLEYRGAIFSWMLVELLSLSTSLFLWSGVFQGRYMVGSYASQDMLLYYFFLPFVGMISGSYICEWLPKRIKDGDINKDIVKPYSFILGTIAHPLSSRLAQALYKLPIYLLAGVFLALLFQIHFRGLAILLGIIMALFALGMHVLMDFSLSLLSFWFDDSWSLSLLKFVSFLILGGLTFPINLAPYPFRAILEWLPFHLVYYLPTALIIGQLPPSAFFIGIFKCLLWGSVFLATLLSLWRFGLKKYSAYGQ